MLSQLAKTLLVLPHSNADPERIFSMVRKIESEERGRLGTDTVSSLLSYKMNNSTPCFENAHLMTKELLDSAKAATKKSLDISEPPIADH